MILTKKELLKKFGLNVKFARMKKGITQEKFAELMGVHPTYVGKIETGKVNMSIAKVLELANVLEIFVGFVRHPIAEARISTKVFSSSAF